MISQMNRNDTFKLLADAFIWSDLLCIQAIHFVCFYNIELHSAKKALMKCFSIYIQFKHMCGIAIFLNEWLKSIFLRNLLWIHTTNALEKNNALY